MSVFINLLNRLPFVPSFVAFFYILHGKLQQFSLDMISFDLKWAVWHPAAENPPVLLEKQM